MLILSLLYITLITTFIIDISGFNDTYQSIIKHILKIDKGTPKPLCSLCLSWWLSLLYLIITSNLTLFNILIAIIFACLTPIFKDLWYTFTDLIIKILNYLK